MLISPKTLLLFVCVCLAYAGKAQYLLRVGDEFVPIADQVVISKKTLLEADTIQLMQLVPGAKELSEMKEVIIVVQQNGENLGAYIYPSGVFGKEVMAKIEKTDRGRLIIAQRKSGGNLTKENPIQSKGPSVQILFGP